MPFALTILLVVMHRMDAVGSSSEFCHLLLTGAEVKPPKPVSESSASTVAWWSCPGVVYFIAVGEPPIAIKIGMAAQTGMRSLRETIVRRLSQIQSSNHELVRLLGVVYFNDGEYPTRQADAFERELHIEFSHLQRFKPYTRGAEWFTSSPELLTRIEKLAITPEELNLPRHVSIAVGNTGEHA